MQAQVQFTDRDRINRDSLVENEQLLVITLEHMGSRVSVQTLIVHIESFYAWMRIPVPRDLSCSIRRA